MTTKMKKWIGNDTRISTLNLKCTGKSGLVSFATKHSLIGAG